jgi:tetratricopeptide (TPR) repeat protein
LLALAWHGWPLPSAVQERLAASEPAMLGVELAGSKGKNNLSQAGLAEVGLAFAHLAGEPGDRLDRIRWWRTDVTDAPLLVVQETAALLGLGKPEAATQLWDKALGSDSETLALRSVRACLVRAELWVRLHLDVPARQLREQCQAQWPDVPELLEARIRDAQATDELADVLALRQKLLALEPNRPGALAGVLQAQLDLGQLDAAAKTAKRWRSLAADRARGEEALARVLLQSGRAKEAAEALANLAPHQWRAATWEMQARALDQQGRRVEAIAALQRADALAPGRPEVAARLALWQEGPGMLAGYRRDLMAVARTAKPVSAPLALALRQTVVQALGNGRQARYEAEVWQVGRGPVREHTVQIEYAPSQTRLTVLQAVVVRGKEVLRTVDRRSQQVSGDDSGMYYESEEQSLRFAGLTPGDRIVVEWLLEDTTSSPYGLVFGELLALADDVPVAERDITVLLPAGKEALPLQVAFSLPPRDPAVQPPAAPWPAVPANPAPTLTQGPDGSQWRQWRWQTGPWPAVDTEPAMPGVTDVLPYLHVSTFASWTKALRWYADLMAEALPPVGSDPVVRELAQRLTKEAETPEAKVRAIHAYAAKQIRYVGLEFGIHSLKPHAVREVIDRRFGDCKDKATLLVALLAEVGVSAQVVLVRTSDLGGLADPVASLGVFNHAIAWVPALNWWLDATAPFHLPGEVPTGDHGATVLRVPLLPLRPGEVADTQPIVLPPAEPEAQQEHAVATLLPRPNGDVELALQLQWRGLFAADGRSRLQNHQTHKEVLQEQLSALFPGLAIAEVQIQGVQPPADLVEVTVRGTVPGWAVERDGIWSLVPQRPPEPWLQTYAQALTRRQPWVLPHGWQEQLTVQLQLPTGAEVLPLPAPSQHQAATANWSWQATVQPRAGQPTERDVVVRHTLRMPARVSVRDYPALRSWLGKVDAGVTVPLRWRMVDLGPKAAGKP